MVKIETFFPRGISGAGYAKKLLSVGRAEHPNSSLHHPRPPLSAVSAAALGVPQHPSPQSQALFGLMLRSASTGDRKQQQQQQQQHALSALQRMNELSRLQQGEGLKVPRGLPPPSAAGWTPWTPSPPPTAVAGRPGAVLSPPPPPLSQQQQAKFRCSAGKDSPTAASEIFRCVWCQAGE